MRPGSTSVCEPSPRSATTSGRASNVLSKDVGALRRNGDVTAAEARQVESRELGETEKVLAAEHDEVDAALRLVLLGIPNVPHPDAPDGASEDDNPLVTGPVGLRDTYPEHQRIPHWETATDLGILDNERATKISGAMFTMQRGAGATLSRALCQYGLDLDADAFEEVRPPSLVTSATLTATGQLPKFADDAYSSSVTTCGASRPPKCRSPRSTPTRSSTGHSCRSG